MNGGNTYSAGCKIAVLTVCFAIPCFMTAQTIIVQDSAKV
jgi:hypothetical protein